MKRADFIKLLGLSAMGSLMMGAVPYRKTDKKGKVIVVGAGIAGITAAYRLQTAGMDVEIIEARNRIGGRIFTDDSFGPDIDLGATWVKGSSGNPVARLANEYKLKTEVVDFDNVAMYDEQGKALDDSRAKSMFLKYESIIREAERHAAKGKEDIVFKKAIEEVISEKKFDEQAMKELAWYLHTYEINTGADITNLSSIEGGDGSYAGDDFMFPKGFKEFLAPMMKDLNIQTGIVVKSIEHRSNGVRLYTNKQPIDGEYVIVTVPVSVLKNGSIEFTPALSDAKIKALESLSMGLVNKVAISFPKTFWEKDKDFICTLSETKGAIPLFLNGEYYSGKSYLVGMLSGDAAKAIENMSDTDLKKKINDVFYKIYKDDYLEPEGIITSKWGSDPYAQGAYSFVKVGGKATAYEVLAEPQGRLRFAGEATSFEHAGSVHGAYFSGKREADRILDE